MSDGTKTSRIELLVAMLIGAVHYLKGSVVEVPADRAKREIARENARATDKPLTKAPKQPAEPKPKTEDKTKKDEPAASELAGWPGEDDLAAVGITTVEGLNALIAEHGDAWPKQVKGVGPATAAEIVERLTA